MIISNATPIINFGKQGKLEIIKQCFEKIAIPKSVYEEVVIKEDNIESLALKKALNEGWITIKEIEINPILKIKTLGKGEKEAISLAVKNNSILLIDDDSAKAYAHLLGVETHGSLYVLFLACAKKVINKNEAVGIFKEMMKEGFYVSTEVYSRFLELLKEIKY